MSSGDLCWNASEANFAAGILARYLLADRDVRACLAPLGPEPVLEDVP